jgi:hypothetical protein
MTANHRYEEGDAPMPYVWQEPELFLEYAGVPVYHCYDDGNYQTIYWYTVNPNDDCVDLPLEGEDAGQFDVRDLSRAPGEEEVSGERERHAIRIKAAIDGGELKRRKQ